MNKRYLSAILFFSVLFVLFGCAAQTNLADYQPKSAAEKEVLDFIIECDEGFQNKNMTKYAACFHDDATIEIFHQDAYHISKISKQLFVKEYLKAGLGPLGAGQEIMDPHITVMGDKAKMEYLDGASPYRPIPTVWELVKENGKWYIIKYDFKI
jgi:hypothetical protein